MGGRSAVQALHSERVAAVDDMHATLEWADAWVDPSTRGVRLIGKGSLPLRLVSGLPGGAQVWAARDGEHVHVVLSEGASKKQSFGGIDQLMAFTARGMSHASGCHHIRVGLHAEKGSADTASIRAAIQLPPLDDAAARGPLKGKGQMTTVRVRPISVNASVTWTSRDKEPVIAISTGWRAREQNIPAMEVDIP
jgi:hypothetical protein